MWDTATGKLLLSLKGLTDSAYSVCFSPDSKRLASGSGNSDRGEVKVWDTATGKEQLSLKGHSEAVLSVCFGPDGKRLASGSNDDTVKVWDAQTPKKP